MISNTISKNQGNKTDWTKTNEYPFYFIRRMDCKKDVFEGISIFFAGDEFTAVVEKQEISLEDIPTNNLNNYKKDISKLSEDFVTFSCIEMALTDGFGCTNFSQNFTLDKVDELNKYLKENGIKYEIDEDDFSM